MIYFAGLVWLLVLVGPLLFIQRQLHRDLQAVFLLITRRVEISLALFALLFFPGVLLHEASHFLAARLLGVRTGGFSLIPRVVPHPAGMAGGTPRLQLGYVETAKADVLRDSLIGAAPLLAGGLFVTYAGLNPLDFDQVWIALNAGGPGAALAALSAMQFRPDFWLWFYLTFVVSSTMLPSAADRRAWLPLGGILALLLGVTVFAGAGPWLLAHLAPPLNRAFQALAGALAISVLIHLVLWLPLWVLQRLLARLTGLRVVT